ncbi:transposase [Ectothiorhodospira sp. BSL-9]|nr:transposase [Ectothiorhodospira sp. BSL-9]
MGMIGHRFRCYPGRQQENILLRWIGCQRFIYNSKVREDRYFRAFARKALSLTGQKPPIDQQYSQFIGPDTAWLREVPSQVLRNGAVRWKQAYSRFFQKLSGRTTIHGKDGEQGVWLTRELFAFEDDGEGGYHLRVGTKKHPLGRLRYVADRPHTLPASIVISINAGQWHVSFATEDDVIHPRPAEIQAELSQWDEASLHAATIGVDRGVVVPAYASTGSVYAFDPVQKQRMARKERQRLRWQRRMARRAKGSSGWHKARKRVARTHTYANNVRKDFAHKVSHALVTAPGVRLVVMEDLKVASMSRRPKAKTDERGRHAPNGARAKAGLNKGILHSAWGKIRTYAQYKAPRNNVLFLVVPPHHSSQECAVCGHIHPDNRLSQSRFVCQRCGQIDHADHNASRVIARRGVTAVIGQCKSHQQVGAVRPEPPSPDGYAGGDQGKSQKGKRPTAHRSSRPETMPTTAQAV